VPSDELGRKPALTEFLAGYGGPPAIDYRGGKVKVIAAIVYRDGVVIEWLVGPPPDLSGFPNIEQSSGEQSSSFFQQFKDRPDVLERMRRFKRLTGFWEGATLTDDLGTQYGWAGGDAGSAEGIGYKGHEAYSPAPPVAARKLTIQVHDLAITIDLSGRRPNFRHSVAGRPLS
jgi:hypothetical protein